jgi:small conductance mechanosensitive channel
VPTDDLWPYYWDMHEKAKKAFDEPDITIPFPQRDVHVYNSKIE